MVGGPEQRVLVGARQCGLLIARAARRRRAHAFACGLELVVGAACAFATERELLVRLRECGVARAERGLERRDLGLAEGCARARRARTCGGPGKVQCREEAEERVSE